MTIQWSIAGRTWGRKIAEVKHNTAIEDAKFNLPSGKNQVKYSSKKSLNITLANSHLRLRHSVLFLTPFRLILTLSEYVLLTSEKLASSIFIIVRFVHLVSCFFGTETRRHNVLIGKGDPLQCPTGD